MPPYYGTINASAIVDQVEIEISGNADNILDVLEGISQAPDQGLDEVYLTLGPNGALSVTLGSLTLNNPPPGIDNGPYTSVNDLPVGFTILTANITVNKFGPLTSTVITTGSITKEEQLHNHIFTFQDFPFDIFDILGCRVNIEGDDSTRIYAIYATIEWSIQAVSWYYIYIDADHIYTSEEITDEITADLVVLLNPEIEFEQVTFYPPELPEYWIEEPPGPINDGRVEPDPTNYYPTPAPPIGGSYPGIYTIEPGRTSDKVYTDLDPLTTTEIKIPNPVIRTFIAREDT